MSRMKLNFARLPLVLLPGALPVPSHTTPQFSREFGLDCASCHSHAPKLNTFGEIFAANGYRLKGIDRARTVPIAVWASGLTQNLASDADRFKAIPNRIELISAGGTDDGKLTYFIEWRTQSREFLSNGSVRDRSGRFEDMFVILDLGSDLKLQAGQFRAMSQIDVSRRLNLAEPVVFSASLEGEPHSDPRITTLRGFSASGRAPGIRLTKERDDWTGVVTVPFPGEFAIPLTDQARGTASFELEATPKGVFVEVFRRTGVNSYGAHGFFGSNDRQLLGVAAQQTCNDLWFEGGIARATIRGVEEWRYSAGFDWIPRNEFAAGVRLDHRQVANQRPMLLPYVSILKPFGQQAAKIVLEGRFQENRAPRWVIEVGWFF